MQSIGDKLRDSKGVGNGFDALRLLLAIGVVAWHANAVVRGGLPLEHMNFVWMPGYAILSIFFALSGFLIAGSAQRLRLPDFLLNRGLRIFPALAVEIILSAFILGLALTTLSAADYLSDRQTWHYLTNIVALINYKLPGVFKSNPSDVVNGSLWTVPLEFLCYAVMSVIMLASMLRRPMTILAMIVAIVVIGLGAQFLFPSLADNAATALLPKIFERVFTAHQSRLLLSFLWGIFIFCMKDKIPYSRWLALLAVLVCTVLACFGPAVNLGYPVVNAIAVPALAYLMAFFGVSNVPTPSIFKKGDYSYGIYLYGYPMQQVMVSAFPGVHSALLQFFLALPVIALFSVFSWHVIEKPILKLRKHFSFMSKVRLAEEATPKAEVTTADGALSPSTNRH